MRKLLFFLILFTSIGAKAGNYTDLTLYSGDDVTYDGNWSNYKVISKDNLALAAAGDTLIVHVTAISATEKTQWPQVFLDYVSTGWPKMESVSLFNSTSVLTAPYDAKVVLTDSMANVIKSEGFAVKGTYYTMNSVVLRHVNATAFTNIWSGSQVIDWTGAVKNAWVSIGKDAFATAKAGQYLRVSVDNVNGFSSVGRVLNANGWKQFDGYTQVNPVAGKYFEYKLTDAVVDALKSNGLIVSGVGYTATSVDLVDTTLLANVTATPDKTSIKEYKSGETPQMTLSVKNNESTEQQVAVDAYLYEDRVDASTSTRPVYQHYTETVTAAANSTQNVTVTFDKLTTPGVYRVLPLVNGQQLSFKLVNYGSTVNSYNIAYDLEGTNPTTDSQSDFKTYWDNAKAQLATIPMKATMTEVSDDELSATGKKNKGNRTIYLVTLQSVPDVAGEAPVTIKGYLAVPKKAGKYPALIYYQGTDAGKSSLAEQSTFYNGDNWVEFRISTRGQMLCRDSKYNYDFYSYCWGDTAKHYYRNAYLDCVRAVDFVKSLDKVDAADIFATGASQGGCFTYIAAALTGAFRAIAPGITGHADFQNGMRIVNWPRAKFLAAAEKLNMTTEQMNQFNSYYDVKNFAPYISCPVISNFSLQDATDPTRTNIAPYLLVKTPAADKSYYVNNFLGHATAYDFGTQYMKFFKLYLTATVNVGKGGWASYSSPWADLILNNIDGLSAYKVTSVADGNAYCTAIDAAPANTGFFIQATEGTYQLPVATEAPAAVSNNLLSAVTETTTTVSGDYYLGVKDNTASLIKSLGNVTLNPGLAYIPASALTATAAKSLRLVIGTPTGINSATVNQANDKESQTYNLAGVKCGKNFRGLVIKKGKKYIQ